MASRGIRIFVKIVIVLLSLASLCWGATWAWHGHSHGYASGLRWLYANGVAAVLVIVIAIFARTTWSGLALFACIALGFASCTENFHLNLS